jgi:hypothetical protein
MGRELDIEAAAHRPDERGVTRSRSIDRRLTHSLRNAPKQSVRESARALPPKGVNRPELVGVAMRRLKVHLLRLQSRRYRSCRSIAQLRRQSKRPMNVPGNRGNPPVEIGGDADGVGSAPIVIPAPGRDPLQRIPPEQLCGTSLSQHRTAEADHQKDHPSHSAHSPLRTFRIHMISASEDAAN